MKGEIQHSFQPVADLPAAKGAEVMTRRVKDE